MSYDFIIVGSGYGGLLPAWRLTGSGARVLLIERGRRWNASDFKQTWDPRYLSQIYDVALSDTMSELYRASRVLGGGSVLNSMMHQRTPGESFDFVDPETSRRDWPAGLNRAALDPFYDKLEDLMGVRQLEAFEIPRIGGNFARLFADAGLSADRGRFNISDSCVRKGFCEAGCTSGGKNTLIDRPLREASETGLLSIEEGKTVARIAQVPGGYSVECVESGLDFKRPIVKTFTAPKVILAAGPFGTVPLLHRSRGGLKHLSPALGHWVSNNGDVNVLFQLPKHYPPHTGYQSTCNSGVISYAFWDSHRVTFHGGFAPISVMAGLDVRFKGRLPWGLKHKHWVKEMVIDRLIPANAMRQIPSRMRMEIDGNGMAKIISAPARFVREHGEYMLRLAEELAQRAGARVLLTGTGDSPLDQGGQHILGGARMSDDPRFGVVDARGEVFGHSGLFVTDCATIPSTLGINPALTIGANALRIADGIARRQT